MIIHSFYITTWPGGIHLFNRTWTGLKADPVMVSGLFVSLEVLAQNLTSQYVNTVNLEDFQFIFRIDEANGLLFVFITHPSADVNRFNKYLAILNTRFIEVFGQCLTDKALEANETQFQVFTDTVERYVSGWEQGETSLVAARIIDVLDIYAHFINTLLQKFLNEQTRYAHWEKIKGIFTTNIATDSPLRAVTINPQGNVSIDEVDPKNIDYDYMLRILSRILRDLLALVQDLLPPQTYRTRFFEHFLPLIIAERDRLIAYQLTDHVIVKIL